MSSIQCFQIPTFIIVRFSSCPHFSSQDKNALAKVGTSEHPLGEQRKKNTLSVSYDYGKIEISKEDMLLKVH